MKTIIFGFLWYTIEMGIADGSDGWLWYSEFTIPKTRERHTDIVSIRLVKARDGWEGIEFIFLCFCLLIRN